MKQELLKEILFHQEKRGELLNKPRKMELYKISKLLHHSTVFEFATKKKWLKVNDLLSGQYSINKNITFKISLLRLDLCDYSDA